MLRAVRSRARLTQEQLAERSSLSVRTIRDLEAGRVRSPRIATMTLLATALQLSDQQRANFLSAATAVSDDTVSTVVPAGRVPRQLPPDTRHFTGRSAYLRALEDLAGSGRRDRLALTVSVICGTAGVGKTALAVHFAHRMAPAFPHGQLYLNLRGFDPVQPPVAPDDALGRLLRALGVDPQQIPLDLDEQSALYRSVLADQRVIVLLDNAATTGQVRPLLPGSPSCLVLATSRYRLDGLVAVEGAQQLPLDILDRSDANALLASVLGEDRVTSEPAAVTELIGLCGNLPLALRIAAANLMAQPTQSIAEATRAMAHGDRLVALAVSDDPLGGVHTAFDLSYRALKPDGQRLFRLLGLAPGSDITVPAAAALAALPLEVAGATLASLTAAHLIENHARGRYRLNDLMRCYALSLDSGS